MDPFGGAWHVRETVFDGEGRRCGAITQVRRLQAEPDGAVRVIQDNQPEAALAGHPLARFAGHHEFVLRKDGAHRRYLGPAVIGHGLTLGGGAMMGRGCWPALGWTFTSWAFLIAPDRQLTGGRFATGPGLLALIAGVGVPAVAPELPAATRPLPTTWRGVIRRLGPDGAPRGEAGVTGQLDHAGCWHESTSDGATLTLALAAEPGSGRCRAQARAGAEALTGAGLRYGHVLELELASGSGRGLEMLEVVDPATRTRCAIRRHLRDQRVDAIDVLSLHPEGEPS